MLFFVYILECADKTYYIGKTNNIALRLRKHNGEVKGGAKYTRSRRPVTLVYSEEFNSLTEALKREYFLKQLTRRQKLDLLNSVETIQK